MKIKNVQINGNLLLAPMAGVTDFAFRNLCRSFGASLTYTEMLSSQAIIRDNKRTENMTVLGDLESPSACQIFGSDPIVMSQSINTKALEKFDVIDINMGCPAPKIVKNGEGSALMKNLPLASKIITSCSNATNKPITVKFRKGFNSDNATEFARMCEESGASLITIHGRTREEYYSGKVDLEVIANVKSCVKIPVIGNGDVKDFDSYKTMLETGVDGVMIGRASQGAPYIFKKVLNEDCSYNLYKLVKEHVEMLRNVYSDKFLTLYMRKHLIWYTKGLSNATDLKRTLSTIEDLDRAMEMFKNSFDFEIR